MTEHTKIIEYYLLCTVAQGGKSLLINQVTGGPVHSIADSNELEKYTKNIHGKLVAREEIVGGEEFSKVLVV